MNGSLLIRAFGTNNGGTSGIFFRNGFSTGNYYNCSILTFDHDNNTFTDGLSINAFDGISFCTGANTRQERMRIDASGNVNIGTTGQNYKLYVNGTTYFNAIVFDVFENGFEKVKLFCLFPHDVSISLLV